MVNDKQDSMKVTQTEEPISEKKKKKSGFWSKFYTFLIMGGFLIILVVLVGVAIGISLIVQSCQGGP
jgi:ABC-type proline/glycine betaine transport system permease subunit